MSSKENVVVTECIRLLHILGIAAWRNNSRVVTMPGRGGRPRPVQFGYPGSPDILAVVPPSGRFLGVECKSETGRQTEKQRAFQGVMERSGGVYLLVRSAAEMEAMLRERGLLA